MNELTKEQVASRFLIVKANTTHQPYDCACALENHEAALRAKVEALKSTVAGYRHSIKIIGQRHDDLKADRDRLREALDTASQRISSLVDRLRGEGG